MPSPFAFLDQPTEAPVLVDAAEERIWTQDELAGAVNSFAAELHTGTRELVFCLCRREVVSVIAYLAAIRAGHAVALLDATAPSELTDALIVRYRPSFVLAPAEGQLRVTERSSEGSGPAVADELAVLLSTSGTTGSPKLVRLAFRNVDANATSIAQYLGIDASERAIQSLPIHYSYGLSVLHSHLAAGASVIFSSHSIMRPEFWSDAARWGATSFAGVPYSYAILERTALLRKLIPETMHTLTQAGGRQDVGSVIDLHSWISSRGGRFWMMYGQTEATARMSYVPPDALPEKAHTIGVPIPGGRLSIGTDDGEVTSPGVEGELVYHGPNVMLGYAEQADDLVLGDGLKGELRTGDVGCVDEDGFFRITGRIKRIAKVTGLRINLDEIEAVASAYGPVAAIDAGEQIMLFRLPGATTTADELRRELARRFGLNSRAFAVREVEVLPVGSTGKIDYSSLAAQSAH